MIYSLYSHTKPTMRSLTLIERSFAYAVIFNYSVFDLKFHLQLSGRLFLSIFLLLRPQIMLTTLFFLYDILSLYLQTAKVQHQQLAEYNPNYYPLADSF